MEVTTFLDDVEKENLRIMKIIVDTKSKLMHYLSVFTGEPKRLRREDFF